MNGLPRVLQPSLPSACRISGCTQATIWGAGPGRFWGMHKDDCDVIMVGLTGTKQIQLAPPDADGIYPLPENPWLSIIPNIRDVDQKAFPRYSASTLTQVNLSPGDLVFIPKLWWHQVCYVDLSFSVSYWPKLPK